MDLNDRKMIDKLLFMAVVDFVDLLNILLRCSYIIAVFVSFCNLLFKSSKKIDTPLEFFLNFEDRNNIYYELFLVSNEKETHQNEVQFKVSIMRRRSEVIFRSELSCPRPLVMLEAENVLDFIWFREEIKHKIFSKSFLVKP